MSALCPVCHAARPYVRVRVIEPCMGHRGIVSRCPSWDEKPWPPPLGAPMKERP